MRPPSYTQSVVDQNVVMRRIPVLIGESALGEVCPSSSLTTINLT